MEAIEPGLLSSTSRPGLDLESAFASARRDSSGSRGVPGTFRSTVEMRSDVVALRYACVDGGPSLPLRRGW